MTPVLALLLLAPVLAEEPPPAVTVGPVTTLPTGDPVEAGELAVVECAALPPPPARVPAAGALVFEVEVRRGRVALVSLVSVDPGVDRYGPCLHRVLASHEWPVRRAALRVPVQVGPPPR